MLGNNLPLSYFIHDPKICDSAFLGIQAMGKTGDIHVDTIALAAVSMTIILGSADLITPSLTSENAGGVGQNLLEMYYDFIAYLTKDQMGHAYKKFLPLIAAIFIFILVGNFVGIGPWKMFESFSWWPRIGHGHEGVEPFELCSPTTDFNVTFALATVSLLVYLGSGLWAHGVKYLKLFVSPMAFVEWLDLVTRPATLALRLLIVITADEILRLIALMLVPVGIPVGVMGFELGIGLLQAFVFALLTSVYIGMTIAHH